MIRLTAKGDFSKTTRYFEKLKRVTRSSILDRYGQKGVAALASATPVDSGLTARSWSYQVEETKESSKIVFCNSNVQNGVLIAIILQHGHGTGTGGWVEGRDYINPAIRPIFDQIVADVWKEVTAK